MLSPNPTTLTIPNAGTNSNVVALGALASRRLLALCIVAPATLPETVNIEIGIDIAGTVTYGVLVSGAADIVVAPGKAVMVTEVIGTHLRLKSGATAAQRDFKVICATRSAARG